MAISRTQRLAGQVLTVLRRSYGRNKVSANGSALEELVLGIVQDNASEKKAAAAVKSLLRAFVDWNEVRVGHPHEIAAALPGIPDAAEKAGVIRAVLCRVCNKSQEMSIEFLRERSQREAVRLVAGIDGFPEAALARATLIALDHDVLPLTPRVLLVCRRIGLLKNGTDRKTMLRQIERAVPTQDMFEFHWLLSRPSSRVCRERNPTCPECKLLKNCPTGKRNVKAAQQSNKTRQTRKTPRKRSKR